MKKVLFLIPLLIVLIAGCVQTGDFNGFNASSCISDSDCATAGCSGEICISKEIADDIFTTCEWKEYYKCLKLTECKCINGKCQFDENQEFKNCLKEVKQSEPVV